MKTGERRQGTDNGETITRRCYQGKQLSRSITAHNQRREAEQQCARGCSRLREKGLETVNLDVSLGSDSFLHDESGDLLTLITLELNDLSELLVVNNSTVACEFLLEGLQQLLLVILCEVAKSCSRNEKVSIRGRQVRRNVEKTIQLPQQSSPCREGSDQSIKVHNFKFC